MLYIQAEFLKKFLKFHRKFNVVRLVGWWTKLNFIKYHIFAVIVRLLMLTDATALSRCVCDGCTSTSQKEQLTRHYECILCYVKTRRWKLCF